ncbi:hypothetical protein ABH975_003137 [Bradyrhizobium ottawaense]
MKIEGHARVTEIGEGCGVVGPQGEGLSIARAGLVVTAQPVERDAQPHMSIGRLRIHGDRPAQQDFGLLKILGVGLQSTEHVQRHELVGRELQELPIGSLGLGEKPHLV